MPGFAILLISQLISVWLLPILLCRISITVRLREKHWFSKMANFGRFRPIFGWLTANFHKNCHSGQTAWDNLILSFQTSQWLSALKKEHKGCHRQMADSWHSDERMPKNWHLWLTAYKFACTAAQPLKIIEQLLFWWLNNIKLTNKVQIGHCRMMASVVTKSKMAKFGQNC